MKSSEPALRAVKAQVQFELAEAAAEVARASALSSEAHERVNALRERCECAASELRGAMERARVNPALLVTMRRVHRLETIALQEWQLRLSVAMEGEQHARTSLADVRNRERSLDRALRMELRRLHSQEQAREMLGIDDLWLQHMRRARS